jgi:hypothetical protein
MSQVDDPGLTGVRAQLQSRDPAALGAVVAGQLAAYRCSTVYGPDAALLREIVEVHALARLDREHDARRVVIRAWPPAGPSSGHLAAELLRQLGLTAIEGAPTGQPGEVRAAVLRAHRVSDRPLVIVLFGLERLLDPGRDRGADQQFVDVLAGLVELPIRGLQLVMAVPEADLGPFRHLLRGRWRLLANDVRVHEDDGRVVVPLGLVGTTVIRAAALSKASIAAAVIGGAVGVAGVVLAVLGWDALEDARAIQPPPAVECPICEVCPECPVGSGGAPAVAPIEGATTGEPDVGSSTGTSDAAAGAATSEPGKGPVEPVVKKDKPTICAALPGDGACATCVRSSCCKQLQGCRDAHSRDCLIAGKVPSPACQPAAIEATCRSLAVCALEYTCNDKCFAP